MVISNMAASDRKKVYFAKFVGRGRGIVPLYRKHLKLFINTITNRMSIVNVPFLLSYIKIYHFKSRGKKKDFFH